VRLQLAASCQRWNQLPKPKDRKSRCVGIVLTLVFHDEDAKDPAMPIMDWIALEPSVAATYHDTSEGIVDRVQMLTAQGGLLKEEHPLIRYQIVPRMLRRWASSQDPKEVDYATVWPGVAEDPKACAAYLDGLLEALKGRRLKPSEQWTRNQQLLEETFKNHTEVLRRVRRVGIHFGDEKAVAAMEKDALDSKIVVPQRIEAVQALALARLPGSLDPLLRLATADPAADMKREALRSLAAFNSDKIPAALLADWSKRSADIRTEIVGMLCGRKSWASALIDALKKGTLTKQDLSENDVRRILAHNDSELTKKVDSVWGKLRERTPEKVEEAIVKLRKQLGEHPGDRKAGRAVFEKNCMVCHKLRGEGHEVGPDLTGANRRDIEYLLVNIIDPNRVVGRDYYTATVVDKSGRSLSGLLAEDTPEKIVLKGENAKLTVIPRADIEAFQVEERSLMPEGLPDKMSEKDFRDLICYLMEDQYLTRGLITGPYKMALDGSGPIEEAADPLKTKDVKWKPFEVGVSGMMDMDKLKVLAPPTDSTAYVYFEVAAPRAMKTSLELAAHEDIKVWVNGRAIHRKTECHEPHRVPVELKEGTNKLLFKVHNIYGPSWLWARLIDPERALQVMSLKAP
jgi:putative heme-binding domain-containing protein